MRRVVVVVAIVAAVMVGGGGFASAGGETGTIKGRVVSKATGEPALGACVQADNVDTDETFSVLFTGPEASYKLRVPVGTYRVYFVDCTPDDGVTWRPQTWRHVQGVHPELATLVTVTANDPANGISAKLKQFA